MVILDTNVLSELMRKEPEKKVVRWLSGIASLSIYTTTITESEILYGVRLLPMGKRRRSLEVAATQMFKEDFAGRILSFGSEAASAYATLAADRRLAGLPISQSDAQIAAIARCSGAQIATRNVDDFQGCGVGIIDPWGGSG
jgi:toxin FitB